ncbi:helix-turn-helix transcriptional regulator [Bradyrhizobium sp. Leo121]|uniref:helix-turn-helix domain-containing protein n=1 Tax=Bradyrhizobium sp. Leo121 TaxID=1571195 RepID=UPI0010298AE8|nr:helix-turn-helix transcriptional regulator [Bradyrhizobium sp. Leo121]RZN21131.1 transcriptional regulator [Bradyrhizobium sp. Leo121]
MITAEQIRAGRALLGKTQSKLAERAGISTTGLNNIERGNADPKASTLRAIEAALSEDGIIFLGDGQLVEGGPGVRLAKR